MKVYEYILKFKAKSAETALDKLKRAAGQADSKMDRLKRNMSQAAGVGDNLRRSFGGLTTTIGAFAGVVGAISLGNFAKDSLNTAANAESMRNAIAAASGGVEGAAKNLSFLDKLTGRLGLNLQASQRGFTTLAGSMRGTVLAGDPTRKIFEGVSYGAAAMGLSAENTQGIYIALGQIMSKGKVQAEELRGQLAERIPSAFQIAARSMKMTTTELDRAMARGEIMATDFLPRFAEEMRRTFQTDAEKNAESLRAKMNRMENALYKFKIAAGNALAPVATKFYELATAAMAYVQPMLGGIKDIIGFLREHKSAVYGLSAAVGVAAAGFVAYKTAMLGAGIAAAVSAVRISGLTIAQLASFAVTNGLTGAMMALNAVFWANPIGIVVGALAALVGVAVWAYKEFDGFRAVVDGAWSGLKAFGDGLYDYVIIRVKELVSGISGIGRAISQMIDGDWSGAWATGKQAAKDLLGVGSIQHMVNTGKAAGEAVLKGYNNSLTRSKLAAAAAVKIDNGEGYWRDTSLSLANSPTDPTKPDTTKKGIDTITGGGKRPINVTVNVQKLNEGGITVHSATLSEGMGEIEDKFMDMLTRLFASANHAAAQLH